MRFLERRSFIFYAFFISLICIFCILAALNATAKGRFFPLDGFGQTFSSIELLKSDAVFGRDYFLYLGFGVVSLLAGFAAFLPPTPGSIAFLTYAMAIVALFCKGLTLFRLARAPLWMALTICVALSVYRLDISGSLRELRSLAPVLTALLLLAARDRPILCGVVAGLAPFWSLDYGIPSAGVFGALLMGRLIFLRRVPAALALGGAALATLAATAFLVSGGRPDLLLLRVQGVAEDQFWYFVYYERSEKIFTFWDFLSRVALMMSLEEPRRIGLWSLGFPVLALGFAIWRRFSYESLLALGVALSATLGAFSTEIGGHMEIGYHFYPADMGKMFAAALAAAALARWADRPFLRFASLAATAALCLWLVKPERMAQARNCVLGENCPRFTLTPEEKNAAAEAKAKLDAAGVPLNQRILGDYRMGLGYAIGAVADLPSAIAFHAMGDMARGEWIKALDARRFPYAETISPCVSRWQPWSVRQNWWLYSRLLMTMRPIFKSQKYILWTQREGPPARFEPVEAGSGASCEIRRAGPDDGLELRLTIPEDGRAYEAELTLEPLLESRAYLHFWDVRTAPAAYFLERGSSYKTEFTRRANASSAVLYAEPGETVWRVDLVSARGGGPPIRNCALRVAPVDSGFLDYKNAQCDDAR